MRIGNQQFVRNIQQKLALENSPSPKLRLEQVYLYASLLGKQQGYPILQDISFEVFKGDRIAIVGASGAGKTFLLRLLNRLSTPSKGKIFLDGREYGQIPVLELRQQIVLVPQESKLLGMTVEQALAYPLVLRGLSKQTIEQRTSEWREKLQIPDDWLNRTEVQLSTGQRQLVAIARALVIQPQILLLDEPTSALDAGTAHRILQILTQFAQKHQTTILMINHQLDLLERFCNCLLHLKQGRLLENNKSSAVNWMELQKTIQAEAEDDFEF
ncbi:MAG: ATP-binding cassette domain-containing protein [Calothrix sp. MO_167.B12]|nr:ATP-binding cassette domain-containing protein [Calothrix sp. MO_167.B12]